MNLEITGRNYEASKRVRNTVEERSEKFSKYAAGLQNIRFTLTQERVDNICEVHLHHGGRDFHTKASTDDMLSAVDKACASMEKVLRRNKAKRSDHRGQAGLASVESSLNDDEDDADVDEVPEEI